MPSEIVMKAFSYSQNDIKNDINYEPETTCELFPGKYYNYFIKSRAKLKLTSGVYFFNQLYLDANSTLELDESNGPVRIYALNEITFRGIIKQLSSGSAGARNFLVGYCGTNTTYLDYGFSGTFICPNAQLIIAQSVKRYEGLFIGKSVTVHQDATIKYLPYLY